MLIGKELALDILARAQVKIFNYDDKEYAAAVRFQEFLYYPKFETLINNLSDKYNKDI